MKTININFVDFYKGFDVQDNEFLNTLRQYYNVIISDTPDYLFYSGFGYNHLKYDGIRIFYTGECITPDFNECDYAIGFDRLSFGDRYARIPLYNLFQYKPEYENLHNRRKYTLPEVASRGFCSFVVSNCFAKEERAIFFEMLSKYKTIASGGRYKNNIGGAVKDKRSFLSNYKFNIAFENSSYDGYVTEKIMEAFSAGAIPIYYGDPRVAEDFNPNAFINANDYQDFDTMIERIKEIDNNDELYLEMLNSPIIQPKAQVANLGAFLCSIINQPIEMASRRPHSQPAKGQEDYKLRHVFFENNVYHYYRKIINQIRRLKTGTILSSKRIK